MRRKKSDEEPGALISAEPWQLSRGTKTPYEPWDGDHGYKCSVELEECIGHGSTAEVWKSKAIHHGVERSAAVKIFYIQSESAFEQESETLQKIPEKHPNILCSYGSGNIYGRNFLVQELMSMDLEDLMKKAHREELTFDQLLHILLELAKALSFLQDHKFVHYDLKPSNVLLSYGQNGKYIVKVADFGCSKWKAQSSFITTEKGTKGYMPPELYNAYRGGRSAKVNGKKIDIFSFGRTIYACVTGRHPVPLFDDDVKGFETKDVFPDELFVLMNRCELNDPSSRPNWDKIIDSLTSMTNATWTQEIIFSFKNNNGSNSNSTDIGTGTGIGTSTIVDIDVNNHDDNENLSLLVHGITPSTISSSGRNASHVQKQAASLERQPLWAATSFPEMM